MSKSQGVLAWHWLPEMGKLTHGDRRKVVPGRTMKFNGDLVICSSGFHASVRAVDALANAPGPIIQRVECFGLGDSCGHTDKLVCRERKCLWIADATDTLRAFARWCALSVIEKWDAPPIVRQYLETGDESILAAARAAAWDAARAAAWDAASAAARDAASDAASDAAWAAAWDAASDAPWAAAWDAAWDAARDAQNTKLEEMLMALAPKEEQ